MRRLRLRSGGHRWGSDERGVSLIFISLSMVMLLGFAAFAIDTGALYQERRTLQVGADASAIAIAEDCARGLPCSASVANTTAGTYADLNADDGDHNVDTVDLDLGAQTVRVVTSTATSGGGTLLQPFFAQVMGFGGTNVTAEAKAGWGGASEFISLPLIFSFCEYNRPPINGDHETNLSMWDPDVGFTGPPLPAYPPPPPGSDPSVVFFHNGGQATECNAVAGQDTNGDGKLPGGFGWIDTVAGTCSADIDINNTVSSSTGNAFPNMTCRDLFRNGSGLVGQFVVIPWFDDLWGSGTNATYHIAGGIGLYVTGYRFPGVQKGTVPCSPPPGDISCIAGYFYNTTIGTGTPGGPNTGVTVYGFLP